MNSTIDENNQRHAWEFRSPSVSQSILAENTFGNRKRFHFPLTAICIVITIGVIISFCSQLFFNYSWLYLIHGTLVFGLVIVLSSILVTLRDKQKSLNNIAKVIKALRGELENDNLFGLSSLPEMYALNSNPVSIDVLSPASLNALHYQLKCVMERSQILMANLAAAIMLYDEDGMLCFCNPYTEVLTGYEIDEIFGDLTNLGDFLESIVLEEDQERYRRARMVSQLGEDIVVRFQVRHRSGMILWLESRMVPICNEDGEVQALMSVLVDVTGTVRYQLQIEEQNRDLNDFTYMACHDLKAPIFTIKGMAAALEEDCSGKLNKEEKENLYYISDAAKRLESLVASIIEYSSISTKPGQEEDVDLNEVVKQVISNQALIIKDTEAEVLIVNTLPTIRGEQVRLYQVFANLIGNALKYRAKERKPHISIHTKNIKDTLQVEVSDNGLGIPENKLNDIFRPYHRAHGAEIEGSGIGLACVKKIVERLGGKVTVASQLGEGSVFTITLPVQAPRGRDVPQDLLRCFSIS